MRIVVQRVARADVVIEGKTHGAIEKGYMLLVGFKSSDNEHILEKMADKVIHLRIFEDENNKMNKSLLDIQGSILSISQFTLYADSRKGRRPSFIEAAPPAVSSPLYDQFNEILKEAGIHVETGIFGADMKVSLLNDGPVTIILDSDDIVRDS